jgi:exodeoxyribonuclease VII small subunit
MAKNIEKEKKFEEKIERIQEIVEILDSGEQSIENMLELYEEGMKLSQECRKFLENAESKIVDITNKYSSSELIDAD